MLAVQEQAKLNKAEVERKTKKDEADNTLAQEREANLRKMEALQQMEKKRQDDFDQRMSQLELMHQQRMDQLAQKVELMKNDQDNKQDQLTELLKNHDDNRTAIIVEQIRQLMSIQTPEKIEDATSYISGVSGIVESIQNAESDKRI